MDRPCATFHLNTAQILNNDVNATYVNGISNNNGTMNNLRTDNTWFNVDFKTILGDMYYQYDKFNLSLAFVTFGVTANVYGTAAIDRTLMINLAGLPFNNCAYNTGQGFNNSYASIGTITLPGNAVPGSFNFTNDMNTITIDRPTNMSNIRIFFNKFDGITTPASAGGIYPAMDFFFHIYGVESSKKD